MSDWERSSELKMSGRGLQGPWEYGETCQMFYSSKRGPSFSRKLKWGWPVVVCATVLREAYYSKEDVCCKRPRG